MELLSSRTFRFPSAPTLIRQARTVPYPLEVRNLTSQMRSVLASQGLLTLHQAARKIIARKIPEVNLGVSPMLSRITCLLQAPRSHQNPVHEAD